jgi:hypothetical protein
MYRVNKKAANAAETAAKAAKDAVQESRNTRSDSNEAAARILEQMKAQTKAMQDSAQASVIQAGVSKTSAQAAENALHRTEAADIELTDTGVTCSTAPNNLGLDTRITVHYKNTGRTRAEESMSQEHIGITGQFLKPPTQAPSVVTVAAGGEFKSEELGVGSALDPTLLAEINEGHLDFHLWGSVEYRDVFNEWHRFEWDSIYKPKTVCGFAVTKFVSRNLGNEYKKNAR